MPFKGDIGLEIIVETDFDLTGATVTDLKIKKPNGTIVTWDADIYDETKLRYVTEDGDLDQYGIYEGMARVAVGTWSGSGDIFEFKVRDTLD